MLNRGEHIAKKRTLWAKIKRLGDLWNEDAAFTQEYAKDVYNAYTEDLDSAITCFSELVEQAKQLGRKIHEDTEVKNGRRI
jgi:hypothetical protein